jgi:hypothetical protein
LFGSPSAGIQNDWVAASVPNLASCNGAPIYDMGLFIIRRDQERFRHGMIEMADIDYRLISLCVWHRPVKRAVAVNMLDDSDKSH